MAVREGFLDGMIPELAFEEFSSLRARQPSDCCVYSRACSARLIVWWCLWDVTLLERGPLPAAEAGLGMADPEG